jgi:hypothetical protein
MKKNSLKLLLIVGILSASILEADDLSKDKVTKVYVATFGRAPDSLGLNYWFSDSGLRIEGIAESFFEQPETKALYPSDSSTSQFVSLVYNNLFNRDPDTAGLKYWVGELDSGNIKKSLFLLAVINGAKNSEKGNDETLLSNKTEVGLYFANAGKNDPDEAKSIMSEVTDNTDAIENLKIKIDNSKNTTTYTIDPTTGEDKKFSSADDDLPKERDLCQRETTPMVENIPNPPAVPII